MNLARYNDDDLTSEPSLDEALADPVIRAVMLRDGISRDDVENVALAARARLLASCGVIAAFPGGGRSAEPGRDLSRPAAAAAFARPSRCPSRDISAMRWR